VAAGSLAGRAAPNGDELRVAASFTLPQIRLDRVASDGSTRAAYVNGTQNVLEPARLANGELARAADGSSGQDRVQLIMTPPNRSAGAPANWGERLPGDDGQTFYVDLTWQCARP
jgi:hypothetical protein